MQEFTQRDIALMMEVVTFWKPQWRFIEELRQVALDPERELSEEQEAWLRYWFYRYREQIKDIIIYDENGNEEIYERFDDVRVAVSNAIDECERYYLELEE